MLSSKHAWYLAMLWETSLSVLALWAKYNMDDMEPSRPVQCKASVSPLFFFPGLCLVFGVSILASYVQEIARVRFCFLAVPFASLLPGKHLALPLV